MIQRYSVDTRWPQSSQRGERRGGKTMKIDGRVLLGGIFTIFVTIVRANGGAIPDFDTDEGISAWHEFGLRRFYGPWGVVVRKPNGDLITYADYGSPIPSDFVPIFTSEEGGAEDGEQRESPSDSLQIFSNVLQNEDFSSLLDFSRDPRRDRRHDDATEHHGSSSLEKVDQQNKRDTLELIGIVGIIENDETTFSSHENIAKSIYPSEQDDRSIFNDSTTTVVM